MRSAIRRLLCVTARMILALRYNVRVSGIEKVLARGNRGILLLPTHPALVDPVILMSRLHPRFGYRALADEDTVAKPVLGRLADLFGVIRLPDTVSRGAQAVKGVSLAIEECGRLLAAGENVMIYPSGHILRGREEEIGGNSAVETVLKAAPNARVALVRTTGLWGSAFSRANGTYPDMAGVLQKGLRMLLANALFFAPRRPVRIEVWEPDDFPSGADRRKINPYIERVFNSNPPANTYVPYYFWERGGIRVLPEPETRGAAIDLAAVPPAVRTMALAKLSELSGCNDIEPDMRLASDLGMDSLRRLELLVWIGEEFGFHAPNPDVFETVSDVFAAASGLSLADRVAKIPPASRRWFDTRRRGGARAADVPGGESIAAIFLARARQQPDAPAIADQTAGVKTFRDIITACLVLKPPIEKMPGERIGIMLPASASAAIVFMAALFAGKTPVMLNWTVGERNINHMLELAGVKRVLTSSALTARLKEQGVAFGGAEKAFVYLEAAAKAIPLAAKLSAKLASFCSWRALKPEVCGETAVILFTSGSESLPKAVPLTHANILANARDIAATKSLLASDSMIGFLPPFHSFGLTLTVILPLLTGVRTVYYPNPTDGGALAKTIRTFKTTVLPGTPTFINGILRGATRSDLETLRIGVTGAEKCPEHVYKGLRDICPDLKILEGYGITECSPVVAVNRPENPAPFSIGKVLDSLEYAVVDEASGAQCAPGQLGMLLVRGPSVFNGYLGYDGPSPFVKFDGKSYYRTGDLVVEDESGTLFFKGRLKRFVKLGGEMISLPAIEEVLLEKFRADDDKGPALAVEALDEDAPEITLFAAKDITREAANSAIREAGLSALHNIRRVERLEKIPALGTGKTDYRALKRLFAP